jgi:two-component system chemotaxis response regulator CheB
MNALSTAATAPAAASRVRVLVVEDSPVVRDFLTHILSLTPDLQVVGVAHDGEQAITMVREVRPDVITMDIHMPGMNGFEATRRIMETQATPIVIVSGSSTVGESVTAIRALAYGAVAIMPRPYGFGHPEFAESAARLVETVRLMAEVKVVRRWAQPGAKAGAGAAPRVSPAPVRADTRIVAIGASTGGPAAVVTILAALPKDLPFPVVLVQHICEGFTAGFAEWLGQTSGLPVHVAADGDVLLPGQVYVAPSGAHLGVSGSGRAQLSASPPENGVRPAVSHLFRSVATAFGRQAVAVLLTGMGRDGAEELKLIRDRGGLTIAQDRASSVIHGMPGEAIRLGGAVHVLAPEAIGALLRGLSGR